MNIEKVEDSLAEKYLFNDESIKIESTEENRKIEEKYKLIGETLDEFGGLFYNKRDYSKKIEKAASNIKLKMKREELIFCELKLVDGCVKRIPAIADFIAETTSTEYKYAAATDFIKIVTSEKIEVGKYEITLKMFNNELVIRVKENLEKISGKIGFIVKKNLKEKRFSFDVINGECKIKLRDEDDVIKNDGAEVYFVMG